jgi:hypothetical protein
MYGDMTPEARVTGLGGGIDGVLQEYRIVPGIDRQILASTLLTLRTVIGQNSGLDFI